MNKPGESLSEDFRFECPFCGKWAGVARDEQGSPALTHGLPFCAEFGALDPIEFIERANDVIAARKVGMSPGGQA